VSISEAIEYRKRKRLNKDEGMATTTTTTTTSTKILTPFQAERVLLISKLRELVMSGRSPIAIQYELGISQRQYYRLYQKAFEHDCKLIEQWDSDTFKEDVAIYKARQEKILAFLMDKMEDSNTHDITRLKAAELAAEMANAIFLTGYKGVFQVKNQAEKDIEKYTSPSAFQSYLVRNDIVCKTLEQYKKAQHKFDNEEEKRRKKKKRLI
jgi:hypothetical protein